MAEAELCREALGLSYGQALALNVFVALAGGIYLCLAGHLLAPGVGRLAVAAPLVAVNLLVSKGGSCWSCMPAGQLGAAPTCSCVSSLALTLLAGAKAVLPLR